MHARRNLAHSIIVGVLLATGSNVVGQATQRAVFTANNGNLEGSVTSYTFNPDNSLHFVAKYITGSTPSTQNPVHGTNAYDISITPNGKHLAVSHTTSFTDWEQITILEVNPDATVSPAGTFQTPDSPLAVQWLNDEYLAVSRTNAGGSNLAIVYHYDANAITLTQTDSKPTGQFTSWLAIDPSGQHLYAPDSWSANIITVFTVNPDGTLTSIGPFFNGAYPLGIGISPDGTKLYSGGGISSGGHAVTGFNIDKSGSLSMMAGSPYTSPGSSPKQVIVSSNNQYALAAHGTDSTTRVFSIDQATGVLTDTGFFYDIGIQGSLGEIAALDDLILMGDRDTITDGVKGLRCFTLNADGSLTQNGTIVDSQGTVGPNALAVWKPLTNPCPADTAGGDGIVNAADLLLVINSWGPCTGCAADINHDGVVNAGDLLTVINAWGACP